MIRLFLFLLMIALSLPPAFGSVERFSSDPITVKLFSENPDLSLLFRPLDPALAANDVQYKPNTGVPSGISLSYAGVIGISYITEINQEKVTSEKGRTTYDDFRFTFAFSRFLIGLNYLRYHGFYIENSADVDSTLSASEPFIRRGDIKSSNIGGSFVYVFNSERFSLPALLDQTQRQQQDGGSWMAGTSYSQFEMDSADGLVPIQLQAQYGGDATIESGRFSTASVTVGYGYTWVFAEKYYVGLVFMAGTGYQARSYVTGAGRIQNYGRVEKIDGRFGLGYNGDTFFIGAHSTGDTTSFKTETIKITTDLLNFQLFMGFRF